MNIRFVISRLGLLFIVLSVTMLAIVATFFLIEMGLDHETSKPAREAFLIAGMAGLLFGIILWFAFRRGSRFIGRREALLLVAMSWLCGAALAALPFFLWARITAEAFPGHAFQSYIDCYFEAMSGLTTTGASVLSTAPSDIESLPHSILLWRSTTHWLGGLGIVVLFVAVLPSLGVGGKRLFRVEAPGPQPEGLRPQIRESARVLFYVYLGLTIAQTLALCLAGMTVFDALCHTFGTLATGGFSTRNSSMGAYHDTPAIDIIVIIFMVLAGANFGLYYQMMRRRFHNVLRDTELRAYLIILLVASALVVISIRSGGAPMSLTVPDANLEVTTGESIRQGVFTTVSIQTTTGYCTSDFNTWPFLAHAVLIGLMFIGGCSGSTAGGIKVIRVWMAMKIMASEIEHIFRPKVIRPLRVGRSVLDDEQKLGAITYVFGFVLLFIIGAVAVMLIEQTNTASDCDFTTASTASIATLCTIGPGLGKVGAVEHYGWFTPASKCVLSLLMLLGRLEVFAIIVLFSPRFWKGN